MKHDNWTAAADRVLAGVRGLSDRKAGDAVGLSDSTILRWRELRDAGEDIPEPRGEGRRVLLEAMALHRDAAMKQPVSDAIDAQLDGIAERAGGNPVYWAAQVEALAAMFRGRALARMADAWEGAEAASKARLDAIQSEGQANYRPAAVKEYPEGTKPTKRVVGGGAGQPG